ncbi:MAG: ABC transporter permease [Candidatus Marinimicrobia bacterium]|nr:ABC transporter permease [Candidatus Neomarinimicrobiota bacterium]
MKNILIIARWEYMTRLRSKWFIISTLIMPLIMMVSMFIPSMVMTSGDSEVRTIAIVDENNQFAEKLENRLTEKYTLKDKTPKYQIIVFKNGDPLKMKQEATDLLESSIVSAYLVIPSDILDTNRVFYYSQNLGNFKDQSELNRTIDEIISEHRMIAAGLDPALVRSVIKNVNFQMVRVQEGGKEAKGDEMLAYLLPIIYVLMLFFAIFMSSQILMRSVLTERANRLIEVLLSSVSPVELMSGKILGLGLLGLTQLALYLFVGITISNFKGLELFNSINVMLFLVYFILGYLLYAAIFAAIGSLFDNEQDAQQAVSIFSLITIVPIFLASYVIANPQSVTTTILSLIPIITPYFMILRIGVIIPPLWQILTSVGLLIVSVWLAMLAAGKIFKVAILIYGKRPTLPEIMQWVRAK